ncbi:hypothetical protein KGY79_13140 [Candidatus Bipolaricaulota bacterium]|nr:hypothetical protein [Candidatus Bipolaricaulota bacterium]
MWKVALATLVMGLLLISPNGQFLANSAEKEEVVARVNGEKITGEEFAERAQVYNVLNRVRRILWIHSVRSAAI